MMEIWNVFLYQPLFNFLIWIYNNWTEQNLGWAVIFLTIILRLVLLPFTIIDERNKAKNLALISEIRQLEEGYKADPILQKEQLRELLRKRKVKPWAKAVVLGIQALVLVLLYQVFLRGITGERLAKILYPSVEFPGEINTIFYGFELGEHHTFFWPAIVGIWLMLEVYFGYKKRKNGLNKADLAYFFLFPLAIFFVLWWLPMVKALFILTSIVFSVIIVGLLRVFLRPKLVEKS